VEIEGRSPQRAMERLLAVGRTEETPIHWRLVPWVKKPPFLASKAVT
jgi:hypothetical protein